MLVRFTKIESQPTDRDSISPIDKGATAKSRILGLLTACVAVAGCLGTAQAAIAQSSLEPVKAQESHQEFVNSTTSQGAAPVLFDAAQQEEISQMLLGFLYFVLPVGVALSIFIHDKYSQKRSATIKQQTEVLEVTFNQHPQH
ncbi:MULTISPECIES: hypothetical protein [unclassified Microcoleus]|uniref:hypothetical protein n=1 Tax=unclassified Microcoleus TaxID=2642155 RepID=UPI002FD5F23E